jgi:chromate reductase
MNPFTEISNLVPSDYLIVSGTDRLNSNTYKVANQYFSLFQQAGIQPALFSLTHFPVDPQDPLWNNIQEQILIPAQKIVFIAPEYNGSIPGILKLMIDRADIKRTWWHKKAMLVGLSTGRAGNLRGMDHLTGILNYLKMTVLPNKLPISSIHHFLDGEGLITDELTTLAMQEQIKEFIQF